MITDFGSLLYDANYTINGVDAIITPAGTGAPELTVTVIDHIAGAEVPSGHGSGGNVVVGTVRPCADVRMAELLPLLAAAMLTVDDLNEATLTLNGKTWAIKSHYPKGGPQGEAAGERRLVLSAG